MHTQLCCKKIFVSVHAGIWNWMENLYYLYEQGVWRVMKKICILCLSLLVLFLTPVYAEEKYTPIPTNDIDEKAIIQTEQKKYGYYEIVTCGPGWIEQ